MASPRQSANALRAPASLGTPNHLRRLEALTTHRLVDSSAKLRVSSLLKARLRAPLALASKYADVPGTPTASRLKFQPEKIVSTLRPASQLIGVILTTTHSIPARDSPQKELVPQTLPTSSQSSPSRRTAKAAKSVMAVQAAHKRYDFCARRKQVRPSEEAGTGKERDERKTTALDALASLRQQVTRLIEENQRLRALCVAIGEKSENKTFLLCESMDREEKLRAEVALVKRQFHETSLA